MTADETAQTEHAPLFIVEHGNPSDQELAALAAVIAARQSETRATSRRPHVTAWTDRRRLVRQPMQPGPGQWRAAGLPR